MAIMLALLFAAAAPPTDKADATCPATRFTLNKPIAPKVEPKPQPKQATVAQTKPSEPKVAPKPGDCTTKKKPS